MPRFEVVPAELRAADDVLERTAEWARAELARVERAAGDVVAGGWGGGAGAAFARGWHDWLAGAQQVLVALDELGRVIGAAGRSYTATDDSVGADAARAAS